MHRLEKLWLAFAIAGAVSVLSHLMRIAGLCYYIFIAKISSVNPYIISVIYEGSCILIGVLLYIVSIIIKSRLWKTIAIDQFEIKNKDLQSIFNVITGFCVTLNSVVSILDLFINPLSKDYEKYKNDLFQLNHTLSLAVIHYYPSIIIYSVGIIIGLFILKRGFKGRNKYTLHQEA